MTREERIIKLIVMLTWRVGLLSLMLCKAYYGQYDAASFWAIVLLIYVIEDRVPNCAR